METMTREELVDKYSFSAHYYKKQSGSKHDRERSVRLYRIWHLIRWRCGVIGHISMHKHRNCKYYRGRGIKVCEEWASSYQAFRRWALLHGYRYGLSIDRIDRNGNYEPGNCQWITRGDNTRKANYYRWHVKPTEALTNNAAFAGIGR